MDKVVIIDYGVGNLLSVKRGFEYHGIKAITSSNPEEILSAKRVVLPGVGAFSNAMQALRDLNLISVIRSVGDKGTPLLGICLGMQLLFDDSEEFGFCEGLKLIPGKVVRLPDKSNSGFKIKVPHIGWSKIYDSKNCDWKSTSLRMNENTDEVYFVHSYSAVPSEKKNQIAYCLFGGHKVTAVVKKKNIIGCQFHPEKSGVLGLNILKSFYLG